MLNLIGKKLNEAEALITQKGFCCNVIYTEGGKIEKSDAEIVVKAEEDNETVTLTVCRFLLNVYK